MLAVRLKRLLSSCCVDTMPLRAATVCHRPLDRRGKICRRLALPGTTHGLVTLLSAVIEERSPPYTT